MYKKKLLLILTSFIFSYCILVFFNNIDNSKNNNPALGDQNQESFAKYNNHPIHCQDLSNLGICIETVKKFDLKKNILWLGNSQLHAINQKKKYDKNASELLFEKLINKNYFLLTLSQPNANLQEHYILYEYINNLINIDILVLPIVFDDLRETNLRRGSVEILDFEIIKEKITKTEIGKKIINKNLSINNSEKLSLSHSTPQDISENFLNKNLSKISQVWNNRNELRVKFIRFLRNTRNLVFGINPQSIRKVIPQRYTDNIQALKAIIESTEKNKIKLLIYIPPIRNDVKNPYDINEYNKFKFHLSELTLKNSSILVNFENIVPAKFWGFKNSSELKELDFMHFKQSGHRILSEKLFNQLKNNFIE